MQLQMSQSHLTSLSHPPLRLIREAPGGEGRSWSLALSLHFQSFLSRHHQQGQQQEKVWQPQEREGGESWESDAHDDPQIMFELVVAVAAVTWLLLLKRRMRRGVAFVVSLSQWSEFGNSLTSLCFVISAPQATGAPQSHTVERKPRHSSSNIHLAQTTHQL
jgi:hypothetical protein